MDNNDVLRRVRYIFDFNDAKMMAIFSLADHHVSREEVSDWLKKEGDADYKELSDVQMAAFLRRPKASCGKASDQQYRFYEIKNRHEPEGRRSHGHSRAGGLYHK
jgi:uncharacterized protein YehS (DUF1456 family)